MSGDVSLPCNEIAASRKIIDIFVRWPGLAVGRERSGIRLLFLAMFGIGLVGVVGSLIARLEVVGLFGLWRLPSVIVECDTSMFSLPAMKFA